MGLDEGWCLVDPLRQPRVLIVEDETDMAEVLAAMVRRGGADVRIAADGSAGLAAVEAFDPDVVVADLKMPLLRGDEMLVELRARGFQKPVIILTAFGDEELTVRALRYDAFDFLEKSVPKKILMAVIQKSLRVQHEREEQDALVDELLTELSRVSGKPWTRANFKDRVALRVSTHRKPPPPA